MGRERRIAVPDRYSVQAADYGGRVLVEVIDGDDMSVADLVLFDNQSEVEADLLRRLNNHDALLAVCKTASKWFRLELLCEHPRPGVREQRKKLDAAIAKATTTTTEDGQ